ncbi:ribosome-associated translation inhibitor RaiA [Anaerofilum sp. BX8]|uniref:Ribosome hibernation promoting factor n=1 Tax=Anaerofilum hominis TaxID=2763016 RepID=A0A923IAC7_9FIRM|nr:ribosome-associated translation inhibitor RaiA [Anaerofilum hominis]MBC5582029.1 ribosome-associated translation inhibitor RaiA [Anaerofilum hominis]
MKISTTGRKVSLKPAFIERADKRLSKLDKFFSDEAAAQVTVTVEKDWQTVEITVRDKGFVARAEKSADNMEDALDAAVEILTKQIVKNRKRLETKLYKAAFDDYAGIEQEEESFAVVREKHFYVKPASVDEAILQMNLIGHSFFLFRNVDSDEINVVYRRKNGTYGLLIPKE